MAVSMNKQQVAVVENRNGELLVAAAAGSGKTFVLVERLLQRILGDEQRNITDFVVITYTNEAARELKQRITAEFQKRLAVALDSAETDLEQLKHLRRQIRMMPRARISTIHSFCTKMLREQGHEVGINPNFRVCTEGEAKILRETVAEDTISTWYMEQREDSPFYHMVNTLAYGNQDERLPKIVLDIFSKIQSHENPQAWVEQLRSDWDTVQGSDLGTLSYGKLLLCSYHKQILLALSELQAVTDFCASRGGDLEKKYAPKPEMFTQFRDLELVVREASQGKRPWDHVVETLGEIKYKRATVVKNAVVDEEEEDFMKDLRKSSYARVKHFPYENSEGEVKRLLAMKDHTLVLMDLVLDFTERYQQEKKRRNILDYGDLEHYGVDLLWAEGEVSGFASSMARQICEMMVDEYQDTNRVQNAIFNALTNGGKTLFLVGDMKQAIYRFRLADPSIFSKKQESFHVETEKDPATEGEPRLLTLDKNFRSRVEVLDGCNDFFADVMSEEFGEVNYLRDGMLQYGGDFPAVPEENPYFPELCLLDMLHEEEEEEEQDIEELEVKKELAEARFVAHKIKNMVAEEFPIADKVGLRPATYSDFMVLLRGKKKFVPLYAQAMAEQGIPIDLQQGQDVFEAMEVGVALSLLQMVDNPLNDLPLLSVLRSPLFGFTAEELAVLKGGRGGRFFQVLQSAKMPEDSTGESQEFLDCLQGALEKRDGFMLFLKQARLEAREKSPVQLLWDLYQRCDALAVFGAMSRGEERQENLLAFYQTLATLETGGSLSLALKQLEKLRELGEVPDAPRKQVEGVVLHTIHKSKGLEKPVVIVAGLFKQVNTQDLKESVLFHQHYGMGLKDYDQEKNELSETLPYVAIRGQLKEESYSEELRVLYVAMTRAREKLILVYTSSNLQKTVKKLVAKGTKPVSPTMLLEKKSMGEIFLSYFLTREVEGKALAKWADCPLGLTVTDTGFQPQNASTWLWEVVPYDGISGTWETATESTEISLPELSAELVQESSQLILGEYPHEVDTRTFSKITATQTKGRKILLEVLAEGDMQQMADLPTTPEESVEVEVESLPETNSESLPEVKEEKKYYQEARVPKFAQKSNKMTAAERGTAMHSFFEFLHLSPDLDTSMEALIDLKSRLVAEGKLSERQEQVISLEGVQSFLHSRWGQEACSSARVAQEFKFSLLVQGTLLGEESQEQLLLQGVVDCWYLNPQGEIVIVDFKSDKVRSQDLPEKALEHGNQMKVYGLALARMLGVDGEALPKIAEKVLWFTEIGEGVQVP